MLSNPHQILRLSQSHLNLLTTCPRKFQNTYLEQISTPIDPQHQEYQTLGSRFHLLMQQREMGLPIDNLLQQYPELQSWMHTFSDIAPDIFQPSSNQQIFRESEHYRTLQFQDTLFTVIYDLLIADQDQAYILDWKTYPKPPKSKTLEKNWQTRLYLYVLAETSKYLFNSISMTYWFVQSQDEIKYIKFQYDEKQHNQTEKALQHLLKNLNHWLQNYKNNVPFPQTQEMQICKSCQYNIQCQRQENQGINQDISNLEKIQEISL